MPPSDDPSTEGDLDEYLTDERKEALEILASVKRSLHFRSFLIRNAKKTYHEIRAGEVNFADDPGVLEERDILRTLSAQIISETYNILEGLAAISMNPDTSPEEREDQLFSYDGNDIRDFYDSYDEDTDLDYFKSIMAYPRPEELGVDPGDEAYYQEVMDSSAEACKDFFLVAKEARDIIQKTRHKFTHGFLLALFDRSRRRGGGRTYPEGCDDMLMTYIKDDDEVDVKGLLTGEDPHAAYLTVARTAAGLQQYVILQLIHQMQNHGDPVFLGPPFEGVPLPEREPGTSPSYTLADEPSESIAELDYDEIIETQLEFFENVDELTDQYGQPDSESMS